MRFKRTSSKGAAAVPATANRDRAASTADPSKREAKEPSSVADDSVHENDAALPPAGEKSGTTAAGTAGGNDLEVTPPMTGANGGRKENKAGMFGLGGLGGGKGGGMEDAGAAAAAKSVGSGGGGGGGGGGAESQTKTINATPGTRREGGSEGAVDDAEEEIAGREGAVAAAAEKGDKQCSSEGDGAGSRPVDDAREAATAENKGCVQGEPPHASECAAGQQTIGEEGGDADDDNERNSRCSSSGSGSADGCDGDDPAVFGGEGDVAGTGARHTTPIGAGAAGYVQEVVERVPGDVSSDADSRGGAGGVSIDAAAGGADKATTTSGGAVAGTKDRPSDDAEAATKAKHPDQRNTGSAATTAAAHQAAPAGAAGRPTTLPPLPPTNTAKTATTPTMAIAEAAAVLEAEGRATEKAYEDALNAVPRVQEILEKAQVGTQGQVPLAPGGAGSDKSGGATEAPAPTATGGSITIYGSGAVTEDHLYEGDCSIADEGGLWRQLQTPHMMFIECQLGVLGVLVLMILVCWRRHGRMISVLYAPPGDVATPCKGVSTP